MTYRTPDASDLATRVRATLSDVEPIHQHESRAWTTGRGCVEHFTPLFITLGAAVEAESPVQTAIEGYQFGLSTRSFQVA